MIVPMAAARNWLIDVGSHRRKLQLGLWAATWPMLIYVNDEP